MQGAWRSQREKEQSEDKLREEDRKRRHRQRRDRGKKERGETERGQMERERYDTTLLIPRRRNMLNAIFLFARVVVLPSVVLYI